MPSLQQDAFIDKLEQEVRLLTSLSFAEMSPVPWAASIRTPTFLYQVRDDRMTYPEDLQAMFDALPTAEKALHWIHGTTARWDGYMEFQRRPEPMLAWFAKYMA